LRILGYRGGITILRDRLRALRPRAEREPFLSSGIWPEGPVPDFDRVC